MNSSQQQLFFVCDRKDVPDDSAVAKVFRESVKDSQPCDEQWAATSSASSREPGRSISMHISRDMVGESTHMQLIFVEGISEYKEKYLYMYIWIFIYKYSFIYRNDAGWDLHVITGLQKPGSREISEREDDSDGSHSSFPVLWRQKILRVRRQAYLLHCKLPWCSTCTSIIMNIFVCLRCKQCSVNTFQNPVFTGAETWDEQAVAEGT